MEDRQYIWEGCFKDYHSKLADREKVQARAASNAAEYLGVGRELVRDPVSGRKVWVTVRTPMIDSNMISRMQLGKKPKDMVGSGVAILMSLFMDVNFVPREVREYMHSRKQLKMIAEHKLESLAVSSVAPSASESILEGHIQLP